MDNNPQYYPENKLIQQWHELYIYKCIALALSQLHGVRAGVARWIDPPFPPYTPFICVSAKNPKGRIAVLIRIQEGTT